MSALVLYRGLTAAGGPLIDLYLRRRLARGKEDPDRFEERRGVASLPRPAGPLAWIHAASVGEAQSALSLVACLLARHADLHVLVTTGTVTSARLLADRLPARALHQFVPVDRRPWVGRFLDHWRPSFAIWIESELWPHLLGETAARAIPAALVNARMSRRSFDGWRYAPALVRRLLGAFDICLAQTDAEAERLRALGATNVACVGNLKFSAPVLPADAGALAALRATLGDRPRWLAASTHPGEEALAAAVHQRLAASRPDLLTVIVPRHPERGAEIARALTASGLTVARRAAGQSPGRGCAVYLADTLGELGLFYRTVPVAFIGGSTAGHGGHNPLEAAQIGAAVVHGPDMANFATVAAELAAADGAVTAAGEQALAVAVGRLLDDPARRAALARNAATVAARSRAVVDRVMAALAPAFDAAVGADARP